MANRLSQQTAQLLKSVQVDLGELCVHLEAGLEKRDVRRTSLTENGRGFTGSEGFHVSKSVLIDEREEIALRVLAFDIAMQKAAKQWGVMDYGIPEGLEIVSRMFAFKTAKAVKTPEVPVTA
jgi:hypothetical protein